MKALFTGTFNPPTLGHLDIIQRAASMFDVLTIGIAINSEKKQMFSLNDKKRWLKKICSSLPQVEIVDFTGLAVDFAKKIQADCIIRGLRNCSDFEYESQMALSNKKMTGIETLFLIADGKHAHLSSTLIREIAQGGRRLHGFVPEAIEEQVFKKLNV